MKGLKLHKTIKERMLLWDALELGEAIVGRLRQLPEVKKAELAGDLRRGKETIGNINILVAAEDRHRNKIMDFFTGWTNIGQVLARGDTKVSAIIKDHLRQVDIRLVHPDEWGAALQYFTGSKEHNIHLRTIAKEKGLKISEYGVFQIKDNKLIAGEEEEDIYRAMDFRWMPPEMREDRGELELAAKHKLPRLITPDDIRGDLHLHTTWSDGMHTIEEVARYVKKNLPYRYIALTDHSKASRIANGMDEKQFRQQLKAIREVNEKLGKSLSNQALKWTSSRMAPWICRMKCSLSSTSSWHPFTRHSTATTPNGSSKAVKPLRGRHRTSHWEADRLAERLSGGYAPAHRSRPRNRYRPGNKRPTQPHGPERRMGAPRPGKKRQTGHQYRYAPIVQLQLHETRHPGCPAGLVHRRINVLNTGKWKDVQVFIEKKRKRLGRPSKGFHLADWLHG